MKLVEALNAIDNLKTNNHYSREQKISWISELDTRVFLDIISTHEQKKEPKLLSFDGYTPETPEDTVLLIPAPYEKAYLYHMASEIEYWDADYEMHNASAVKFNDIFEAFAAKYNSTHMPLTTKLRYF